MLKVLHAITTLGTGGIERWLLSMIDEIPRTECQMDVCCKGDSVGSLAPLAQELGAKVYLRPLKVTQLGFIKSLRGLVVSGDYHVVHNHLQAYSGLPVYVCRGLRVPVITSFHCTEFPAETWLRRPVLRQLRNVYAKASVRYALQHSTMLTGCSQDVVDSVCKTYGRHGVAWQVLHYGVDLPPLASPQQRHKLRNSFGWPEDTPVIIHVGRFAEQKNHLGLLQIFERVVRQFPTAKLLLVGGGPLRPAVEQVAQKRGLSQAVRFLGYRHDVPALLSCSDLFLFPSWFEGFGVAAMEASAAGVAVVASNVPGLAEAIQDGVTGLLRDPRDIDAMAEAASCVLSKPDLAHELGAAGRARVRDRFSKQASAESLLGLYDECLS